MTFLLNKISSRNSRALLVSPPKFVCSIFLFLFSVAFSSYQSQDFLIAEIYIVKQEERKYFIIFGMKFQRVFFLHM